jgi:transcription elongation factor GreA
MQTRVIYLTEQGAARFAAELKDLVAVRRPQVTEQLRRAREINEGDASEYKEARTEQAFVEGRIQELEALLASARRLVDHQATDRVQLGSSVTVVGLDSDEPRQTYRIVSSHEADPRRGLVSDASPAGRALLGHCVNEDVTVHAPGGAFRVRIVAVS